MELVKIIFLYLPLTLLFLLALFKLNHRRKNLPPAPPSLPIVGHLHLLKPPIHRLYHRLSHKYGPILSLRFGSRLVVVVSSSALAEECFTRNDKVLANRVHTITTKYLGYNNTTVSSSSYGEHWRNLRRVGAVEIFSSARLNAFLAVRTDEVRRLLIRLSRDSKDKFATVELKSMLTDLTLNNIVRMVAGRRYYGNDDAGDEEEAKNFRDLVASIFRLGGSPNLADYFPILKLIAKGKYEKKIKNLWKRLDRVLQGLVNEHRQGDEKNTMIDHLLDLQKSQPDYYTDEIIKGLVLVLLLAGTDTSAVTLEWAMANLLNNPRVLQKVKAEIDEQIGEERLLEEEDVAKLPYLQQVIWETLRLYPALPLLLPHVASEDCTIGGYNVPQGTTVVVNAWAIHREPEVWEDAESFKPERMAEMAEYSHKLMPFGMGRRACPGAALAQRVVALALGSMVQCFEWRKVSDEAIEMSEGIGSTMPKARPLEALCRARPIIHKLFYAGC